MWHPLWVCVAVGVGAKHSLINLYEQPKSYRCECFALSLLENHSGPALALLIMFVVGL